MLPKWSLDLVQTFFLNLRGNKSVSTILSNTGWFMLDKLLRLGLNVAIGIWIARYLGPAQYGQLTYTVTYIVFFQAIVNLGLDGITVRNLSNKSSPAHAILGTVFILKSAVGIGCWLFAVALLVILNGWQDKSVILSLIIGGSLCIQSTESIELWLQSQSQIKKAVVCKSLAYLISNSLKVWLIFNQSPLILFACIIFFESVLISMALVIAYQQHPCAEKWKFKRNIAKNLLSESWPFIISGLSVMIYMRIDQIMIKEIIGIESLGIYAAVLPLATLWQIIPMSLNSSLAPFVSRKKMESEKAYLKTLTNIFKTYALIGWVVCIGTVILSPWLVPLIFGASYKNGINVLCVYVFTNLFINMGMAHGLWMINEKKPYVSLINTASGAFVCILGNLILLPHYGIIGAAIAAVFAQAVSAIMSNIFVSRKIFNLQVKSLILIS